jgi:hypothetical protein
MRTIRMAIVAVAAAVLGCCSGGEMTEKVSLEGNIASLPAADAQKLLAARIYFGHQSVGLNILEGIADVLTAAGSSITITEARDTNQGAGPGIFHSAIGENENPLAKIRDFDALMRAGWPSRVDAAFMKLCYVDIRARTDVDALFAVYRDTMARLKADFPRTIFVHFTAPIMSRETGIKASIKRLVGREIWGDADNIAREKYNALLRKEYQGREPLFDLALLESTRADGSRTLYSSGVSRYATLEAAYTDDGGHLNACGRAFIAERLLLFLAGTLR